ncbi:MAG: CPBP family intramembrane metalloprotease [Oscillibacter sp.]|nr:CPBP family intramembrane metalloprotease [Oscillibacter sp.]
MVSERTGYPVKKVLLSLLSIVILIAAQTAAVGIGELIYLAGAPAALGNGTAAMLYPVLALLGLWALCRRVLKESPAAYRITPPQLKAVWCVSAVLLPALVCGIYLLLPGHWATAEGQADTGVMITSGILFTGFAAGIVEEAVFRGVLMSALERRWGCGIAVLVPSVLFGALHIIGNDLDALSMVQLVAAGTMVGVMFSLVACESGNIWNGALMHGVWNSILLTVLHIGPEPDPGAFFNYVPESGNFLLTGGDFGVEASIISMAGYALFAALALVLLRRKRQ